MESSTDINLCALYSELQKLEANNDFGKALNVCDKSKLLMLEIHENRRRVINISSNFYFCSPEKIP